MLITSSDHLNKLMRKRNFAFKISFKSFFCTKWISKTYFYIQKINQYLLILAHINSLARGKHDFSASSCEKKNK